MGVLVECYQNASHWSTRRQILSIMADKVSFKVVKSGSLIFLNTDTISRDTISYFMVEALLSAVPLAENTRLKVSPIKLDHFLTFITSRM